jgi:hypothetical protein
MPTGGHNRRVAPACGAVIRVRGTMHALTDSVQRTRANMEPKKIITVSLTVSLIAMAAGQPVANARRDQCHPLPTDETPPSNNVRFDGPSNRTNAVGGPTGPSSAAFRADGRSDVTFFSA